MGGLDIGPFGGICIIFSVSLIIGASSSLISWKVLSARFILPGVLIISLYIINLILSLLTHQNIVNRFPAEKAVSARRISLALISQFIFFIPFAITSILYISNAETYSIPNNICVLISRISIIANGFIYGHTNRRIAPHFYSYFGKTTEVAEARPKQPQGPPGQVNVAFSDEAL